MKITIENKKQKAIELMKKLDIYKPYTGILTLEYYDGPKLTKIRYVGYSLRDAIKKFRQDNGLIGKHVKIIKLY